MEKEAGHKYLGSILSSQSDIRYAERDAKYNQLSLPEALETPRQRVPALAAYLKRETTEIEARRINQMSLQSTISDVLSMAV